MDMEREGRILEGMIEKFGVDCMASGAMTNLQFLRDNVAGYLAAQKAKEVTPERLHELRRSMGAVMAYLNVLCLIYGNPTGYELEVLETWEALVNAES